MAVCCSQAPMSCQAQNTGAAPQDAVILGSKNFTESVILGEILTTLSQAAGAATEHRAELGGTQILWNALAGGEIDAYVEYTGTITEELFAGEQLSTLPEISRRVEDFGVTMGAPLGFDNTYALGMQRSQAEALQIRTISDLRNHRDLKLGISNEFSERDDGWPGLRAAYRLPDFPLSTMEHSLAYRGINAGSIDLIDLYATDPEIISYRLTVLEDDLDFFPSYQAVILYRAELAQTHPQVVELFEKLEGKIDQAQMTALNKASRVDRRPEPEIARDFVGKNITNTSMLATDRRSAMRKVLSDLWGYTYQHVYLVCTSLLLAIVIGIPIGILAYKIPEWGEWILGAVGILQTLPSLALFAALIPLMGLGAKPAIFALFLYSLLPIVRGTYTGLTSLPENIRESALALGLPGRARMLKIELPLARRSILGGIKTSAVINVGTATIGALIGAGGYGEPILTGLRLDDQWLILQGALPAALLALSVQALFSWIEFALVPAALRTSND